MIPELPAQIEVVRERSNDFTEGAELPSQMHRKISRVCLQAWRAHGQRARRRSRRLPVRNPHLHHDVWREFLVNDAATGSCWAYRSTRAISKFPETKLPFPDDATTADVKEIAAGFKAEFGDAYVPEDERRESSHSMP